LKTGARKAACRLGRGKTSSRGKLLGEFRRLVLQLKPDQLPTLVEILRRQFDNDDGDAA
jgi:hypothetical protein